MKAIDLYSGIGGWRIGLEAAGVDVVRSYEWWAKACDTQLLNFGERPDCLDIRQLRKDQLPEPGSIDFVVGSPPCTQFSFANRGGSGDLTDGLRDIEAFLKIVDYLRPRAWAMENVPRVAGILRAELEPSGSLSQFKHLVDLIEIVNAADYGLPQSRKRMIAGTFDWNLFDAYKAGLKSTELGTVLTCLGQKLVKDPNWGFSVPCSEVTDREQELDLLPEEARMNREAKTHHPVYNGMAFPDALNRPARTVTATCTRVSRESIVVPSGDKFRRLTVRERATLQGFPVSYQFKRSTFNDRLKMVGNAVPPVLTYYLAHAMKGTKLDEMMPSNHCGYIHSPHLPGDSAKPDTAKKTYPSKRSFRFAIPGLRFGSGVRFELANSVIGLNATWTVKFFYGSSKDIIRADISSLRLRNVLREFCLEHLATMAIQKASALNSAAWCSGNELQARWIGRDEGPGPFELIDSLAELTLSVEQELLSEDTTKLQGCAYHLFEDANSAKMSVHWVRILAGALAAMAANLRLGSDMEMTDSRAAAQPLLAIEQSADQISSRDAERHVLISSIPVYGRVPLV